MKKITFTTLITFISLLVTAQTNYYVSTSGSNSNSGSITSPFLTIQNALNIASAGSTIYVREGSYAEKLWWANSGTPGNPITLINYDNEPVTISGTNATNASQGGLIVISSKSHIRIKGITFADNIMNYADGINVSGSGTDIEIANCEFSNIGWTTNKNDMPSPSNSAHAIVFVGNSANSYNKILISGNYIHDCITGYSENVTLVGNIDSFIVENNTINFNTNIGIDAAGHFPWTGAPAEVNFARNGIIRNNVVSDYAGPAALDAAGGIYVDGGSFITVENNTVFNYKVGFSVGCEVPGNSNLGNVVRNNLAYDCSLSGLFVGSNTTSLVYDTQVYNNNFFKCGTGQYDNGQIGLLNNSGTDIRNNIMYPTVGRLAMVQFNGTISTDTSIEYNLFWRDNSDTNNLFYNINNSQNEVLSNPEFADAYVNDFHLMASSAAIDAGDPNFNPQSESIDIDGEDRILNGTVDIGIDEYKEILGVDDVLKNNITFYPNPTNGILTIKNSNNYNYEIYTINGQTIKFKEHGIEAIDFREQADGMYVIKLINKITFKASHIKIIKQ